MQKWLRMKWSDLWQKEGLKIQLIYKEFNRLGYRFREDLSSEKEYIFERLSAL